MRGYIAPISFGALLAILSIATIVGVGLSVVTHRATLIPVVIGVALAIGVVFILFTVSADDAAPAPPRPPEAPSPPPALDFSTAVAPDRSTGGPIAEPFPVDPVDLEPGYDPVEEADELDSGET